MQNKMDSYVLSVATYKINYLRTILLLLGLFAASPSFADWMALAADSGGTWGISVQKASQKQAESVALKSCTKAKGVRCKVVGVSDSLGYVAVATSKTSVRAFIDDSLEDAEQSALEDCAKKTKEDDNCTIEWTGINGVFRKKNPTTQIKDCRPKSSEIRCRSNCVNGDCVVEYENSCKIRVHVSPRFDSFSNEWTYPSPPC